MPLSPAPRGAAGRRPCACGRRALGALRVREAGGGCRARCPCMWSPTRCHGAPCAHGVRHRPGERLLAGERRRGRPSSPSTIGAWRSNASALFLDVLSLCERTSGMHAVRARPFRTPRSRRCRPRACLVRDGEPLRAREPSEFASLTDEVLSPAPDASRELPDEGAVRVFDFSSNGLTTAARTFADFS